MSGLDEEDEANWPCGGMDTFLSWENLCVDVVNFIDTGGC